jgi:hypothetical protein
MLYNSIHIEVSTGIRYQVGWKDMIRFKPLTSAAYPVQAQLGQVWWACRYNSTPQLMRVSTESYLVFTLVNILHLSIPACLTLVTYSWLSCNNTKDRRAIGTSKISSSPVGVPYARLSRSFFVFLFLSAELLAEGYGLSLLFSLTIYTSLLPSHSNGDRNTFSYPP